MLNYEADAFEVFDFLLTCIHTWSQTANSRQKAVEQPDQAMVLDGDYNLAKAARVSCDKHDSEPCFVHQMFYLNIRENRVCSCGKQTEAVQMDQNLFADHIFMDSLVQ